LNRGNIPQQATEPQDVRLWEEDTPATNPEEIARYFDRLWPLLRSITGDGVRHTLDILSELVPMERHEIPSGTNVFDWTVPQEWVVRDAFILAPDGKRILDMAKNNLHLLNYSIPFRGEVSRAELDQHLHSLPELPQAIPYVTSYYEPRWGFCLSQDQRDGLPEGAYQVVIDTDHINGSLTYGEAVLPGTETAEVLISTNVCHPSLANNELSGPLVSAFLYRRLESMKERRLTYRFVFIPETIGCIAFLSTRGQHLRDNLVAGYSVTCIGDDAPFTYKRSRAGNSLADRAALYVLSQEDGIGSSILDFFPDGGSDERQYCSPGFDLPVGSLMRSMYLKYPEYHTSLDNRDFISFQAMSRSIDVYYRVMQALDVNLTYLNLMPWGEPQLGKRGLYPTLGVIDRSGRTSALRWLLNFADGDHDLLSIAERSGQSMGNLHAAVQTCLQSGLIKRA
jgi:aminopeptidase-like protein